MSNENGKLTAEYEKLKQILAEMETAFGKTLSPNNSNPYDFNRAHKIGKEWIEVKIDDRLIKFEQNQLVKRAARTLKQIQELQGKLQDTRQEELDGILDKEMTFIRPSIKPGLDTMMGTYDFEYSEPNTEITITLPGKDVVTARYALEVMLPKILILREMDTLLLPVRLKAENLKQRASSYPNDTKLSAASAAAADMLSVAKLSRTTLIDATSVPEGLKLIATGISAAFKKDYELFAEYRGNEHFDAVIDGLRKLAGYAAFILSYPWRIYDNKGVDMYVSSFWEKRHTASLKTFGFYDEKMKQDNLLKNAGLTDLQEMVTLLNPKK